MAEFVIVTDSTTDLPQDIVDKYKLEVLPLKYNLNGKEYLNLLDHSELPAKSFYDEVLKGAQPTTSQINPEDYISRLTPILKAGKDILILAFSSALSGTYNSARIAAEQLKETFKDRKILLIDTKSASLGEGLLVYHAAKEKEKGKTIDEVYQFVLETMPHLGHWFTVDDLKHLRRGGRISATAAFVGGLVNIKPVMHCSIEGKLIPRFKAIGRKKAIRGVFEQMVKTALPGKQTVFIGHGDDLEAAEMLAAMIKEKFEVETLVINYIGPVIGSHTGQGVLALFFLANQR